MKRLVQIVECRMATKGGWEVKDESGRWWPVPWHLPPGTMLTYDDDDLPERLQEVDF